MTGGHRLGLALVLAGPLTVGACGKGGDDNPFAASAETGAATTGGDGPSQTTAGSTTGQSATSGEASETVAADDTDGDIKLDVGPGATSRADDEGSEEGCQRVDFLFIVDNSGSMLDEQENLIASFGDFIAAIQDTVMAQDYHLMVVDTDAESLSFNSITCGPDGCTCEPSPQCCYGLCSGEGPVVIMPLPEECGGMPCDAYEAPTGCDATLGAGKVLDPLTEECGIVGDNRWMTDQQPELVETFECVALVGAGGDGNERPMEAMLQSLTTQNEMDACNDGFLRDDAILVVTFISDEEDLGSIPAEAAAWHDGLVAAKNGQEDAIVVLGLLGDSGVAGGLCTPEQADDAPKLRAFAESFTHGQWASVCNAEYDQFFLDAVSVIDTTCDEFRPEG